MTATIDLTQVSLRVVGSCKNHPDWYVFRCQKCRRDARTLHDRAAQKHIDVATQAITEAKATLTRHGRKKTADPVLAEHKLRLAVLAQHQWGAREEAES